MDLREYIAPDLLEKFEFYSYNHALEIITQAFPAEWSEIVDCLRQLRITTDDFGSPAETRPKNPQKVLRMCCIPAVGARSAFRRPPHQVLSAAGRTAGTLFPGAV